MLEKSSFLLLMLLILTACQPKEKAQEKELIRPVQTQQVGLSDSYQVRSFAGLAKSNDSTPLSFQVNGRIEKVFVQVGDKVKQGQIIAQIDDDDYNTRVAQGRAGILVAQTKVNNAKSQYERVRNLYESDSVSRNDLDSARAAYDVGRAALSQAQEEQNMVMKQSSYTRLKIAKNDCAVAAVNAHENQNIAAGQPVVLLECGHKLEVEVSIPETIINSIKLGVAAKVKFSSLPDTLFKATVTEVGVSTAGGITFPVTLVLEGDTERLRAGMTADVFFPVINDNKSTGIVLPFVAVGADQKGNFVYLFQPLQDGQGTVKRQTVKVGPIAQEGVTILDGLSVGQQVITAGINQLQDGMKVKLLTTDVLKRQ